MSTFVAVGNSKNPFPRLLGEVERLAEKGVLPAPIRVQHGHTPFTSTHCEAQAFMRMEEFDETIRDADLVILQAGGGSVLTAVQFGKVPVLLPRRAAHGEVVDDHQIENARNLASLGRVVVAWESDELERCIVEALTRQAEAAHTQRDLPALALIAADLQAVASRRGRRPGDVFPRGEKEDGRR